MLSFMRENVMAFLSLSRLPWLLHLSGELFFLFYQTLIGEAECLHLVPIGLHRFQAPGGRLSVSPGGSCILDGLASLLLVFRVDTISN